MEKALRLITYFYDLWNQTPNTCCLILQGPFLMVSIYELSALSSLAFLMLLEEISGALWKAKLIIFAYKC